MQRGRGWTRSSGYLPVGWCLGDVGVSSELGASSGVGMMVMDEAEEDGEGEGLWMR